MPTVGTTSLGTKLGKAGIVIPVNSIKTGTIPP